MPNNEVVIEHFLDKQWMEKGLSQNTLDAYRFDLQRFSVWIDGAYLLTAASNDNLREYLKTLFNVPYKIRSIIRMLSSLRCFFQYLCREGWRDDDPSQFIERPYSGVSLPHSLSEIDVNSLLESPNTHTPLGLRDRAMLELLYASGLRVSELINIAYHRLDLEQGVVRVMGKGNKERLVPMGEEATYWLDRYMSSDGRKQSNQCQGNDKIFITRHGKAMTRQAFWYVIKKYALKAGIDTSISPHTLRHAFATHLLNHGADLRVLQILLGHSNVSTTQIYTHIAIHDTQTLHAKHHPRG